jgi:hypothetical protein
MNISRIVISKRAYENVIEFARERIFVGHNAQRLSDKKNYFMIFSSGIPTRIQVYMEKFV